VRPVVLGLASLAIVIGCGGGGGVDLEAPITIQLTSPSFAEGEPIPRRHTCDGEDRSPPLAWSSVPAGTKELALLVDDPDAGTFVHWVVWGLDPAAGRLAEGEVPDGAVQGRNGFGKRGYGGPCPPKGDDPHRYVFTLFALSRPLALEAGASAGELKDAVADTLLAQGQLVGRYARPR
jgi:Raf kinase inhibitor-like YbhB/YbcL family protein